MANPPSDFLDVDEVEPQPRMQRSRSGGYVDHLEEQSRRDRNHREREMKRYHESRYGASLASRQRSAANRLSVPIFENNTRRNRSTSEAERRRDSSASPAYSVQEVRPGSRRRSDYGLPSEALIASQFPPGLQRSDTRGKHHTKKPSIKVQIHQDKPPASRAVTTSAPSTKRSSPNISPRSPGAQPQLSYQYTTLQQKLSQIAVIYSPYLKVEAANPSDLTFSKINEIVRGYAFDLQVWASLINVQNMARIDSRKREVVEAASRNLDRLIERTKELSEACKGAKPRDLKFEGLDERDEEDMFDHYEDSENGSSPDPDPTSSPGFIIHSCLHSMQLQIQTLKRLTRSLQEASPDAKDEVVAIESLVDEVSLYFGSREALDRYAVEDRTFAAGGKALADVRGTAAAAAY